MSANIFPEASVVNTTHKEKLLAQKGIVIWMVGLSGSGKSTLAKLFEKHLHDKGVLTQLLDGDNLRTGINSNLGFTENDRIENLRRVAEIAKLFNNCGIVTICSFISPTNQSRAMAKQIVGENNFYEVFVSCPLEVCEKRDVKGLYKKARYGEVENFTVISSPFEEPQHPFLKIETDKFSTEDSLAQIISAFADKIKQA